MIINKAIIRNFKGINEEAAIELRPYTIFIGPNSSGKSTVIHALTALAQTVRQANDTRPLILDDEQAQVHLGRFIEIIHSHSYVDRLKLGIGISGAQFRKNKDTLTSHETSLAYEFGCTLRTQETFIERGELFFDDSRFDITRKGKTFTLKNARLGSIKVMRDAGFRFKEPNDGFDIKEDLYDEYRKFSRVQLASISALRALHYLGPFRQPPQRRYQTRGSEPIDVGAQGENTVTILANALIKGQSSRKLIHQVGEWFDLMGVAKKIEALRVGGSDLFELIITLNDGKKLPIADLGYGLSQVLPVLVQCAFAPMRSTLLFEQPELHLHPLAQKPLAKVFINARKIYDHQFVIETHSRELLHEFIAAMRAGRIKPEEFIAYRVTRENSKTKFEKIAVEKVGDDIDIFTNWEAGFCSEV